MEEGDIAVHGHEVYPSDVPSLGLPGGIAGGGSGEDRCLAAPSRRSRQSTAAPAARGGGSVGQRPVSRPLRRPRAGCRASSPRPGSRRRRAGSRRRPCAPGCSGCSSRIAMSSRAGERASCGIRATPTPGGDQALDGLVVVALEGDAGLEAGGVAGADDVAGAGAGRRGLHPGLLREVLEPHAARSSASRWPAGSARCSGSSSSGEAAQPGPEPLADALELEEQRRGRTRPRAAAGRSPPARPRPGSARPRGARRGRRRSPAASASRPRSGRRPCAAARRGRRRSPRARPRRRRSGPGSRRRGRRAPRPAAVGRTPRRSRSISGTPASASSVAIACETADCV